jgi:tetratricopeptide (TPR) repeat protein
MRKMKTITLAAIIMLFASSSIAQTLEDGKKFMYYEKFKSAKDVFQKLASANPADESATYYLGQAMIGLKDLAGAKSIYQQKLSATPNSPLVLAGMGHIGLLEGNTADARSRFETAINLSAGKRIDVLNAVGYANGNPEAKNGDAAFAIDKLTLATTLKGFKSAEVLTNLGDAYRKNNDGSNAERNYMAAAILDPSYVRSTYRSGRLYQSQGYSQENLFLTKYNEVIAKDPNYGPVYNTLFNYYYNTEVSKSAVYMEKWLANSDDDGMACYYRTSMKFAQGKNNSEVVTKCDECIAAGGASAPVNLYGLKAFAQSKIGDSLGAKASFEQYLQKQIPAKIGAGDYFGYAEILLKFPNNEAVAASYVEKAIALDTLESGKVIYVKAIANAYRNIKNYCASATWFNRLLSIKKNYNNVDIYNAGIDYFNCNKFDSSVITFNKYITQYPEEINGYYFTAIASSRIDSTMATGQGAEAYLKLIEACEKTADKTKVKDKLIDAYTYMMQYTFNIKKDQPGAIAYADKALALDPANAESIKNKEFVTRNNPNARPTTRPTVPAKTVPAKAVPAKTVPAKTVPAKPVPAKTVPAKTTTVKAPVKK